MVFFLNDFISSIWLPLPCCSFCFLNSSTCLSFFIFTMFIFEKRSSCESTRSWYLFILVIVSNNFIPKLNFNDFTQDKYVLFFGIHYVIRLIWTTFPCFPTQNLCFIDDFCWHFNRTLALSDNHVPTIEQIKNFNCEFCTISGHSLSNFYHFNSKGKMWIDFIFWKLITLIFKCTSTFKMHCFSS